MKRFFCTNDNSAITLRESNNSSQNIQHQKPAVAFSQNIYITPNQWKLVRSVEGFDFIEGIIELRRSANINR